MFSDSYKILFDEVKIGPLVAKNRFYQVPHCTGLGHLRPQAEAEVRRIKAEGGWAVVSTQETEIHPTSDLSPFPENRIWDERDIPALRLMTDAVHSEGSLAAIQLVHNGYHSMNQLTRAPLLAPSEGSLHAILPRQARQMDKKDIKEFRIWHKQAVKRGKEAGFDIIYVYAGHHMTLPHHFLLPRTNERLDEYGGSLENRARLLRELLEDSKDVAGNECAVALRFAVDEMQGIEGMQAQEEGREIVEMLRDYPDLWDVNVSGWDNDSITSRFEPREGYQEEYVKFVKKITSKPVVGVGRFSSPDKMVEMIKNGILDFIGAARPSISDPFLPKKISDGRIEEIRECIGCNICVACDSQSIPIRCTQNPTMGEEWRRGWHPEKINIKGQQDVALVVGAGPSGLECVMQLARRGYNVILAEADDFLGGRCVLESGLAGLGAWRRLAEHRIHEIQQRNNVEIYRQSLLDEKDVLDLEIPNVFFATGARWRSDGVGRRHRKPIKMSTDTRIFVPEDIMRGIKVPEKNILIFDDDQIYLAGVLAEHLANSGLNVTLVTPASVVSPWTENTLEQPRIQKRLMDLGVRIFVGKILKSVENGVGTLSCIYDQEEKELPCSSVLLVTERKRNTYLYDVLVKLQKNVTSKLKLIKLIGDAAEPGLLADAVYSGHMAARHFEIDPSITEKEYFRREIINLDRSK